MSIATPNRYSPNTFFSISKPTGSADAQQCSHQRGGSSIVATPTRKYIRTTKLGNNEPLNGEAEVEHHKRTPNAEKMLRKKRQNNGSGKKQIGEMFTLTANFYATPSRQSAAHHFMRRENSASAIVIPKRNNNFHVVSPYARFTPPINEDQEFSPVFAGSKFIESPSAKSLPLPPLQWLEERRKCEKNTEKENGEEADKVTKNLELIGISSESGEENASSSESNENYIPGNWSPPSGTNNKTPVGIRMHPLHLIAATVLSN